MNETYQDYGVITIRDGVRLSDPIFGKITPNNIFIGSRKTGPLDKGCRILKRYENLPEDQAYRMYVGEFLVPKPALIKSPGWLSPTGAFFPCASGDHTLLGLRLSYLYYDSHYGERDLIGWFRIKRDGKIFPANPDTKLNKKQFDSIIAIYKAPITENTHPEFDKNLIETLTIWSS